MVYSVNAKYEKELGLVTVDSGATPNVFPRELVFLHFI